MCQFKKIIQRVNFFILCVLPFVFVSLLWWKYPNWIYYEWMFDKILVGKVFAPSLGEFGDVYGALNTLFSGLAFSGVIISIVLQSSELRATRKEMEAQVAQFEQQTKAMQKQVFESSFFSMINLHNTLSIRILESENNFMKLCDNLNQAALLQATRSRDQGAMACKRDLECICENFMKREYSTLGHYFRYFYQILYFIDIAQLEEKDKKFYSGILRAQLSNHELFLIFVNSIGYKDSCKCKELVEKFSILEHVYDSDLNDLLEILNKFRQVLPERKEDCNSFAKYKYSLSDLKGIYADVAYGY